MANSKEFIERRKHERFKVKNGPVATVFNTASEYIHMGQIKNISKGGLAFRYIDRNGDSTEPFELDILVALDSFYIKNVPFKTVWVSPAAGHPAFIFLEKKQRGIRFGEMTPLQMSRLDYFIHNYTIRQQEPP